MADAVAEGLPFWGFETIKGSVLYLGLEDSGYRLNTMITITPVLCIYPFLQRFLVKGIMIGAVKG